MSVMGSISCLFWVSMTFSLQVSADCPPVSSIFDLPNYQFCRHSLALFQQRQPYQTNPPDEQCCQPAQAFLAANCDCWKTFHPPSVAALRSAAASCPVAAVSRSHQFQGGAGVRQGVTSASSPVLYVGVLSSSGHRDARDAIRATWGSHPSLYRVRFFLGHSPNEALFDQVRQEAVQHGDMVVLPLVQEHYDNITHQTLEICRMAAADPEVTHMLKVDDDSYVRVTRLLGSLQKLPPHRLFWGFIENPGGGPHRDPSSQWYVSKEEWGSERYPPWAHGAGYVLSADLAQEIAAGAALKPLQGRIFKLEDISVGSWVEWVERERGVAVTRVKDARFNFNGCAPSDVVSHYVKPQQQVCMWEAGARHVCRCPPSGAAGGGSQQQQQLVQGAGGVRERLGGRRDLGR